jgi:transcriptional regulator with XRE-family HTH domain
MTQYAGPGIRRHILAKALVGHREAAGLKLDDVVRELDFSKSKISRIENATSSVSIVDIRALAGLYRVDITEAERLEMMARIAKQRGWWHAYHVEAMADWLVDFVVLESEAVGMDTFEIDLIPGLLQTRTYSQWIIRSGCVDASDEFIANRVEVRANRQLRLQDPKFALWAILDEAALRRMVGGRDVQAEQLAHLVKVAELPNVTLQILPFSKGPHTAMGTPFCLLKFSQYPPVVYMDNVVGGTYMDGVADVERYRIAMDHLRAIALDPRESVAFVRRVAMEL